MNTAGTVALAALSGVGLLFSLVTVSITLVAGQAMSGAEPLSEQLMFYCGSFAVSFGVAAACTLPWYGPHRPLQAGGAYAVGGAVAGGLQAISLASVVRFEPQLRALTNGGPLGMCLVAATLLAFGTAAVVGRVLLQKAPLRRSRPAPQARRT